MASTEHVSEPLIGEYAEQAPDNYKSPKLRQLESICAGVEQVDEVRDLFNDPTTGRVRVLDNDSHAILGHSIYLGGDRDWMLVVEHNKKEEDLANHKVNSRIYTFIGKVED